MTPSERVPASAPLLTAAEVRKRVRKISKQSDDESQHADEDALYHDVLTAIATSRCADAAACAREALKTEDLNFSRWYA